MRIRRYYGYDCDSVMGFNNGHYIDDDPIEVKDLEHAEKLCAEYLENEIGMPRSTFDFENNSDTPCVTVTTGYYDKDGNDLTFQEYSDRDSENDSYRYIYVSGEIEE